MRRILVDRARRKRSLRHGGARCHRALSDEDRIEDFADLYDFAKAFEEDFRIEIEGVT